jgi:hypothetical protein
LTSRRKRAARLCSAGRDKEAGVVDHRPPAEEVEKMTNEISDCGARQTREERRRKMERVRECGGIKGRTAEGIGRPEPKASRDGGGDYGNTAGNRRPKGQIYRNKALILGNFKVLVYGSGASDKAAPFSSIIDRRRGPCAHVVELSRGG